MCLAQLTSHLHEQAKIQDFLSKLLPTTHLNCFCPHHLPAANHIDLLLSAACIQHLKAGFLNQHYIICIFYIMLSFNNNSFKKISTFSSALLAFFLFFFLFSKTSERVSQYPIQLCGVVKFENKVFVIRLVFFNSGKCICSILRAVSHKPDTYLTKWKGSLSSTALGRYRLISV